MSQEPPTRTGPTEDRPATPRLQLRVRLDSPYQLGAGPRLHFVAEIYERSGSRWARLTCRTGPVEVQELLDGAPFLQALKDFLWLVENGPQDLTPDSEEPRP